jgi:tetratricopeptide (TPR) repeat protein
VLNDARKVSPRDLRTLFQLGAVLERQRRPDAAEQIFREALNVQPDAAPVLNYLGYMNAERGVKVDEAVTLIQKAIALDPENGAYLDSLGWALFRLDRVDQAEQYLRRAVDKEGKNAVVLDHLADVLKRQGNVKEALELWRRALDGEDEGEELDRARVEQKIREAQTSLNDPTRRPRP